MTVPSFPLCSFLPAAYLLPLTTPLTSCPQVRASPHGLGLSFDDDGASGAPMSIGELLRRKAGKLLAGGGGGDKGGEKGSNASSATGPSNTSGLLSLSKGKVRDGEAVTVVAGSSSGSTFFDLDTNKELRGSSLTVRVSPFVFSCVSDRSLFFSLAARG
jgi:hypothetical protein